ncbi:hydroxyethylthiazole kinase [Salibacterium halotolerans]|uniref:Hydroxyethylthiazole kinase n=1 Tax=Salibacterium halotolerans TaxID=1884432 RepID=A0A1I5TVU0_9BACI|nr:hydroxyethylthiazole kinase [Salibacterium halotolerans]SFP87202.1 hydroxyethylthiazole kinase [Salibacterium halotolerans]
MKAKEASVYLEQVRTQNPLIHNITNTVVANFNANGLLAAGASPVMSDAPEEAADMAGAADALVLNIGTLHPEQVESMFTAGRAASRKGIPIVVDPVGAGATPYRTDTARELLKQLEVTLLRGNAGEVSAITGLESDMKGVDTSGDRKDTAVIAEHAAQTLGIPVAVTGPVDAVSDGRETYQIYNGHSMMAKITGSGCLASAVAASFLTVSDQVVEAAAAALGFYGTAAERAEGFAANQGPGTFQVELLNALYHVGELDLRQSLNMKQVTNDDE